MTWLAWVTFCLAAFLALVRVPAALRGRNRTMFWLFAILAAAILLSIEAPYLAIDRLLGGMNLANLLLRFFTYGVGLLLGIRVARAFGARRAEHALVSAWGLAALGIVAAGTVAAFILMDPGSSSVGMNREAGDIWFVVYATLGRVYPAFTGVILLPSLVRAVRENSRVALRFAAGLLAVGYVLLALTTLFTALPRSAVPLMRLFDSSMLLCILGGLTVIWISGLTARKPRLVRP